MKTIEEKAKAYDEALEKVRNIQTGKYKTTFTFTEELFEYIFPALKEDEDERIRKALMQNLKERFGTKGNMGEGLDMPDVLAWLEKQGEKDKEITILKDQIESLHAAIKALKEVHKIELKKQGEQILANSAKTCKDEQKPAWSEEDEARFESCIKVLQTSDGYDTINANWLKSLKYRLQPQPKQEWSERDACNFKFIHIAISYYPANEEARKEATHWFDAHCNAYPIPAKLLYHWKPSEEQMVVLNDIIINGHLSNANERILKGLQEQLKKLKD